MRTAPVSPTGPCLISVNLPKINLPITQHISNMYALYIHTTHTHLIYTCAQYPPNSSTRPYLISVDLPTSIYSSYTYTTHVYTLPNTTNVYTLPTVCTLYTYYTYTHHLHMHTAPHSPTGPYLTPVNLPTSVDSLYTHTASVDSLYTHTARMYTLYIHILHNSTNYTNTHHIHTHIPTHIIYTHTQHSRPQQDRD